MAQMTTTLGAVLTHTTGRMLAPLEEFYDLQDFVVGSHLLTHERTYRENDITARLLIQFPELAEAHPPEGLDSWAKCHAWVISVAEHIGWSTTTVNGVGFPDPIPALSEED